MKNLKDFILENLADFDTYLKSIKDKGISFEEFESGIKETYNKYEIHNIMYSEKTKSITIVYNLGKDEDTPYALDISLEDNSTKEKLFIKKWNYEEL